MTIQAATRIKRVKAKKKICYSDYRPVFKKFKAPGEFPEDLFMGFEMEVDPKGDYDRFNEGVEKVINKTAWLYAKQDGSVEGCEINSFPFNWNWFCANKVADRIKDVSKFGKASRACGFHIHLSRAFFSEDHLAKMVYFFYKRPNPAFIRSVSQRTNMDYCHTRPTWRRGSDRWDSGSRRITSRNITFDDAKWLSSNSDHWHPSCERYCSLNLYPTKTIEIRIFQGTVNQMLIKAYLEFALAVSFYTGNSNPEEMTVDGFKNYVNSNPRLFTHLIKTGLMDTELRKTCKAHWNGQELSDPIAEERNEDDEDEDGNDDSPCDDCSENCDGCEYNS